jgi:hypothetical protein
MHSYQVEGRYAFLQVQAHSGAGVDGATPRRRPACVILTDSLAIATSCSRSVRLCYKNARSVTSGRSTSEANPPHSGLDRLCYKNGPFVSSGQERKSSSSSEGTRFRKLNSGSGRIGCGR